jgi:hypothetical protein
VIHFGRNSDNDREHGILKGKLTLNNEEIASTFNDSVKRTVQSCQKILQNQHTRVCFNYLFNIVDPSHYLSASTPGWGIRRVPIPPGKNNGVIPLFGDSSSYCGSTFVRSSSFYTLYDQLIAFFIPLYKKKGGSVGTFLNDHLNKLFTICSKRRCRDMEFEKACRNASGQICDRHYP